MNDRANRGDKKNMLGYDDFRVRDQYKDAIVVDGGGFILVPGYIGVDLYATISGGQQYIKNLDNELEYTYTKSISEFHKTLMNSGDTIQQIEHMNSIVNNIRMQIDLLSREKNTDIELSIILRSYLLYIVKNETEELRKDPYLYDDTMFEDEYAKIHSYLIENQEAMRVIISQINKNKKEEDNLEGNGAKIESLEDIDTHKAVQFGYKNAIEEYYSMTMAEYVLLLKKHAIAGGGDLSDLSFKLYNILYTKSALDVLSDLENDNIG